MCRTGDGDGTAVSGVDHAFSGPDGRRPAWKSLWVRLKKAFRTCSLSPGVALISRAPQSVSAAIQSVNASATATTPPAAVLIVKDPARQPATANPGSPGSFCLSGVMPGRLYEP
jgi:hypothetical protein